MNYAALLINGNYIYGCIDETGCFEPRLELTDKLPVVNDEVMDIVETLNIPELGYTEKKEGGYEIFHKNKVAHIKYTVPVYAKVFGNLTLTTKKTLLSIPTDETLKAAKELYSRIENEVFKIRMRDEIEKLNTVINAGNGIACVNHSDFPHLCPILFNCNEFVKLFEYQYEYYIVGIPKNKDRLKLSLEVPKSIAGRVIGKGGKNVKEMARKLGVMSIDITAI